MNDIKIFRVEDVNFPAKGFSKFNNKINNKKQSEHENFMEALMFHGESVFYFLYEEECPTAMVIINEQNNISNVGAISETIQYIEYIVSLKKGSGKRLLKKLFKLLKSKGDCRYVELDVLNNHERLIKYYNGLGFECKYLNNMLYMSKKI